MSTSRAAHITRARIRSIQYSDAVKVVGLSLLLLVAFRALIISHFNSLIGALEILLVLSLAMFTAIRIVKIALSPKALIRQFEFYLLLLSILPVIGSIAAQLEFGQPFIYGMIAFKDFYLVLSAALLYRLLHLGMINVVHLKKAFLLSSWICLIYFLCMSLLTDPRMYQDTLLAGAQQSKGSDVYYRFSMAFIFYGCIHYWVKTWMERNVLWLIPSLLFMGYVVFFRMDRTSMLALFIGIGLFTVLNIGLRRIVSWSMIAIPFMLLPLLALLFLEPTALMKYSNMFSDAFGTIAGEQIEDGAALLRQYEWNIAFEHFQRNPFLGNGKLTGEWVEGGFDSLFGFFYPGDVGILGQLFLYGIPGTLILYAQFLFGAKNILNAGLFRKERFFLVCCFFLLVLFLDSLTNGSLTTYAAQTAIMIAIISYYADLRKSFRTIE